MRTSCVLCRNRVCVARHLRTFFFRSAEFSIDEVVCRRSVPFAATAHGGGCGAAATDAPKTRRGTPSMPDADGTAPDPIARRQEGAGMSKITMRLGKLSATVAPAAPPVLAEDGTDITELVALVRDGTDAQKETAADALKSLGNPRADNVIAIAKAGGIPPLVALVRDGTDDQKKDAAEALWALMTMFDGTLAVNDNVVILTAEAGGIPPLVALVRDGNDAQKENAAGALCCLADCADNQIAIAKAGGIPPFVVLLRDGNDAAKAAADVALGRLALNADNQILIAEAKREAGI